MFHKTMSSWVLNLQRPAIHDKIHTLTNYKNPPHGSSAGEDAGTTTILKDIEKIIIFNVPEVWINVGICTG